MDDGLKISLQDEVKDGANFSFLREEGLKVIRHLAATSWTDHNLHDPGITLHEAASYAFTQVGMITGLEMQDLLASGEALAPQEFFTAGKVLPSAPVLLKDFQKLLIDHPLINRAWVTSIFGEPLGRLSVLLEFEDVELNSNTVNGTVTVGINDYNIDFVFPNWDDVDILPLQREILIGTKVFDPLGNPWLPIAGSDAYFNRVLVNYQDGFIFGSFKAWVVLLVTTPVTNPSDLPLILTQASNLLLQLGTNGPGDQTILKQYNRRVTKAFETTRRVRRYMKHYRNLCELIAEYRAVRIQEIGFTANIEVAAGVDVESLLADIFFAVEKYVAPQITTVPFLRTVELGLDTDAIFDGPLLDFGFIPDDQLSTGVGISKLYVSDIVRLIIQLRTPEGGDIEIREQLTNRSIIAVSNVSLALYLDNRNIITGAKDCLQLINSTRHIPKLSPQKSRVTFRRNNADVDYNINRAIELFGEKLAAATPTAEAETPDYPIPNGDSFPVGDYYPLQNDLPVTYGVGKAGLPATAPIERKALAKQLKGYLFFFEQIIAGHLAQLAHINSIFSAKEKVTTTLHQQPIYQIPRIQDLFLNFVPGTIDPEGDWLNFQADPENSYRRTLRNSVESEDQFLERRHRMLDHLMARLGEEMQEFTSVALRQSNAIPNATLLPLAVVSAEQQRRRSLTLFQLLENKGDYYYDLPWLNHSRGQAFGIPSWRKSDLIKIIKIDTPVGPRFGWQIMGFSGTLLLQHFKEELSEPEARRKAEEVLSKGTSDLGWGDVADGALFRVRLDFSTTSSTDAVSASTFSSSANALTAIPSFFQDLRNVWLEFGLAPIEARLYHLLGFAKKGQRRKLVNPLTDYFEIFDNPFPLKAFRLHETTSLASPVLLQSQLTYPGTPQATDAINETIKNGILAENYFIDPLVTPFVVQLKGSDGNIIARSPGTFPDISQAEEAAKKIRQHLFMQYSMEGFYMVEHILLYPPATTDPRLIISDSVDPCQPILQQRTDPYSFQVTFVFPSGYSKEFTAPNVTSFILHDSQPDRYRDIEFRDYVERTIRKACPAHILPVVIWLERATGTLPLNYVHFDVFETTYRSWLNALFIDEAPESTIGPLRNALVTMMNNLFFQNQ
jgi:hypothetical protein